MGVDASGTATGAGLVGSLDPEAVGAEIASVGGAELSQAPLPSVRTSTIRRRS